MGQKVDSLEVKMWVERLRNSKTDEEAARAASRLSQLRIRTRGTIKTRGGGFTRAAESDFPPELENEAMEVTITALKEKGPAVRREVAFALGQWSDETAAQILAKMLVWEHRDEVEDVRLACIDGLRSIAGRTAIKALQQAAEKDPSERVRYAAIEALGELALAEEPKVSTRSAVRTRGEVVRPKVNLSPEAIEVLTTLLRIRDNEKEPEYIRRSARAAIIHLEE